MRDLRVFLRYVGNIRYPTPPAPCDILGLRVKDSRVSGC